jgi:hypothetical protein
MVGFLVARINIAMTGPTTLFIKLVEPQGEETGLTAFPGWVRYSLPPEGKGFAAILLPHQL